MLCIGVLGGHLGEKTIDLISRYYKLKDRRWVLAEGNLSPKAFYKLWDQAQREEAEYFLIALNKKTFSCCLEFGVRISVLLYLSGEKKAWFSPCSLMDCLDKGCIVIINSDDKRIFQEMVDSESQLITCGMNQKANVTLSSVTEEMGTGRMVCCLQHKVQSVSGHALEPQEFAVKLPDEEQSVSGVLAAVTALMATDMEMGEMTDFSQFGTSKEKIFE